MAKCVDTRPCFAKIRVSQLDLYRCSILKDGYEKDGECPFCKTKDEKSKDEQSFDFLIKNEKKY